MARHSKPDPDAPPPLPGASKARGFHPLAILGVVVGVVMILGLVSIGVLFELGHLQDTALRRGDDLPEKTTEALKELVLRPDESVEWFYTLAVADVTEDGNLLTDRRVVSYWQDEGEVVRAWAFFEDITAIRVQFTNSILGDSELQVWQREWSNEEDGTGGGGPDDSILLYLSPEEERDHEFVEDLLEAIRRVGNEGVSVEVGGELSTPEMERLKGAVSFDGGDWEATPAALMDAERR